MKNIKTKIQFSSYVMFFYNLKLNYIPPPIQWYVDGAAVVICFSRRRIVYGFPLPLLLQAEKLIPGSEEHVSHGLL